MGAKSLSPNRGNQPQGGDVPPFDLPPSPMMGANPNTLSPYPIQGGAVPQVAPIPQFQQVPQAPQNQLSAPQSMDPGFLEFLRQKYGNTAQGPSAPQQGGMTPVQGVQQIPPGMMPPQMPYQVPGMGMGAQGVRPQRSPDEELRMLYQTQLGREGDQGGMDYWRQRMAEGMTPDQVQDFFRGSTEGQAHQRYMQPMMDDFGHGDRRQMHPDVEDALRLAHRRQMTDQEPADSGYYPQGTGDQGSPRDIGQIIGLLRSLGVA